MALGEKLGIPIFFNNDPIFSSNTIVICLQMLETSVPETSL